MAKVNVASRTEECYQALYPTNLQLSILNIFPTALLLPVKNVVIIRCGTARGLSARLFSELTLSKSLRPASSNSFGVVRGNITAACRTERPSHKCTKCINTSLWQFKMFNSLFALFPSTSSPSLKPLSNDEHTYSNAVTKSQSLSHGPLRHEKGGLPRSQRCPKED